MKNIFWRPGQSLAAKLIIAISLLMIIGSFVFWYAILRKQEHDLQSIAGKYGGSFVEFIKESTRYNMLTLNKSAIQKTLEDMSIAEGISRVRIYDHKGNIFYSSNKPDIHNPVDINSLACMGCHVNTRLSAELLPSPKKWDVYKDATGLSALKIIEPIYNEPVCYTAQCHVHSVRDKILGFIEADASLALLDQAKLKQGLALTAYVAIFFMAISLFLGIILWELVYKPIRELVQGMEKVAAGDFDYSVPIKYHDEMGKLAKTFNAMIKDIRAARDQRESWTRTLEAEVAKKTEEIQKTHAGLVQTEKLVSLGRMAAGVAHEINNPLTGVVTFSHLMLKRVPPGSLDAEDLQVIIEQAERCAKIIKNLLTFARATPSEKGEVSINDVLNRTLYMVRNQEKFHNIKFDLKMEETQFITLGDASQFQQIFLNMLINAVDAMNERGTIEIATRKIMVDDRPFVEIEFTDTGCGIPEASMGKLFEPFFTTKPVGKGTGLGLAVSHGIVRHYGGHIVVKSAVGKGTSFFVRLPLVEVPA